MKTGLGISEVERMQIVKALNMTQGHWFKCPNGHPYAIGECGGAMETSKCNECGADIGQLLIYLSHTASELNFLLFRFNVIRWSQSCIAA